MDKETVCTLMICGSILLNTMLLIHVMNKTDQTDIIVNELEWRVGDLEDAVLCKAEPGEAQ